MFGIGMVNVGNVVGQYLLFICGVIPDANDDRFVVFVIYCAFMFRKDGSAIIITQLSN